MSLNRTHAGIRRSPVRALEAKRMRLTIIIAVFAVMSASSGIVAAHEGHNHRIMGTVTMAAADHVMLKDKDGKDVTVKVTRTTKIRAQPALKVEEIKSGTRVVITATQEKDKSFTAKIIEVGAAPAAAR
jgi:hypothetical protein